MALKIALPALMVGVGIVAGLLLTSNALLHPGFGNNRQPVDLLELVRHEQNRMAERNEVVGQLRQEVEELRQDVQAPENVDEAHIAAIAFASGRTPAQGPGLQVQLWDAPIPVEYPSTMRKDDYVVHQQDLEAVINALWAGGAEAITVQGHRLTALTQMRCVGNVLLIGNYTYSPPYVIEAIGDPLALEQAVYDSEQVQSYLWFVDRIRLGWSLEPQALIEAPADDRSLALAHSSVPGMATTD